MPINRVFDRMRAAVTDPHLRWARDPKLWVEMFATVNLAILAADIFIAHSVNHFTKAAEYIPLYFSLGAPVALAIGMALRWICRIEAPWRDVGYLIGTYNEPVGAPSPLGTSPVTATPGFPSRDELVDRYVERSGREVDALAWFEALALWKAAVFCEAIYGRYVRGELGAEDTRAARFELGVPYLAESAASIISA